MTTPTACASRCSLHSKRDVHVPCVHCSNRHVRPARDGQDTRRPSTAVGLAHRELVDGSNQKAARTPRRGGLSVEGDGVPSPSSTRPDPESLRATPSPQPRGRTDTPSVVARSGPGTGVVAASSRLSAGTHGRSGD